MRSLEQTLQGTQREVGTPLGVADLGTVGYIHGSRRIRRDIGSEVDSEWSQLLRLAPPACGNEARERVGLWILPAFQEPSGSDGVDSHASSRQLEPEAAHK